VLAPDAGEQALQNVRATPEHDVLVAGVRDALARSGPFGKAIPLHYRYPIKARREYAGGKQTGYAAPDHERVGADPVSSM
jgi:hypothetical protein